jgi:Icc-related predicted phosphoesterase
MRELTRTDGTVKHAPEGCVDIHRRVVNHKGLLIAGFEGSMRYNDGEHQYSQREMSLMAAAIAPRLIWNRYRHGRPVDIIITHAAPWGIQDGSDLPHQGFRAFVQLMERYKPRYLVHGHTHLYRQDAPRMTQFGETTIINSYGYQILEIDEAAL